MKINTLKIIMAFIVMVTAVVACQKLGPAGPEEDELLDGPIEGLTHEQSLRFLKGDIAFNDLVFTAEMGLGPVFVATSCGSCHAGDGKGHPFSSLTRFGQTDETGNKFLHLGGPQLQNRALPGYQPETIPEGATFSKFIPPAVTGLGYFSFVPDADILAMADPDDLDGDGISGVPAWVNIPGYVKPYPNAIKKNGKYIGRFQKKGSIYNLLHQTVDALNQDIGIASFYNRHDVYTKMDTDPEISLKTIHDIFFYLETLKAPIQRDQDDPTVMYGKKLFNQIGCEGCHKPTLKTGPSYIEPLSNVVFHPYTDLLLHDLGPELDDGYTEGSAKTYEWKTAALWGLGLSEDSQGGQYFLMHDGRARSIDAAILMHGGEGSKSRDNFKKLTKDDKDALLTFLKSL